MTRIFIGVVVAYVFTLSSVVSAQVVTGHINLDVPALGIDETILQWRMETELNVGEGLRPGGGANVIPEVWITRYTNVKSLRILDAVSTGIIISPVNIIRDGQSVSLHDVIITSYSINASRDAGERQTETIRFSSGELCISIDNSPSYCTESGRPGGGGG